MHGRYPYIATEVLCSEIWSIVETCLNHYEELLTPFWDAILNKTKDDMIIHCVTASYFSKINGVFIGKKPAEVAYLIQSYLNIRMNRFLARCWLSYKRSHASWNGS